VCAPFYRGWVVRRPGDGLTSASSWRLNTSVMGVGEAMGANL
jgi:hypothetical protein